MENNQFPVKTKDWTRDDFGRAVKEVLAAQARIDELDAQESLAKLDLEARFEEKRKEQKAIIAPLMKSIRAAFKHLAAPVARRIQTPHGVARLRALPRKLVRDKELTDSDVVVRMIRARLKDCFKVEHKILVEVLETKSDELVAAAGYHWSDPTDRFELVEKE